MSCLQYHCHLWRQNFRTLRFAGQQEKSGGYPCSPLAQSPAGLHPDIPTNIENGGSLFDQENSVMKTKNVPQSWCKLRNQVKEKISEVGKIKASGAAVVVAPGRKGAALKEMSLNVLSGGRIRWKAGWFLSALVSGTTRRFLHCKLDAHCEAPPGNLLVFNMEYGTQ
jgi:hypothetical protein